MNEHTHSFTEQQRTACLALTLRLDKLARLGKLNGVESDFSITDEHSVSTFEELAQSSVPDGLVTLGLEMRRAMESMTQLFMRRLRLHEKGFADLATLALFDEYSPREMWVSEVKNLPAHKNKLRKDCIEPYAKIVIVINPQFRIQYSTEPARPTLTLYKEQ